VDHLPTTVRHRGQDGLRDGKTEKKGILLRCRRRRRNGGGAHDKRSETRLSVLRKTSGFILLQRNAMDPLLVDPLRGVKEDSIVYHPTTPTDRGGIIFICQRSNVSSP
jgi:hypothetical protein